MTEKQTIIINDIITLIKDTESYKNNIIALQNFLGTPIQGKSINCMFDIKNEAFKSLSQCSYEIEGTIEMIIKTQLKSSIKKEFLTLEETLNIKNGLYKFTNEFIFNIKNKKKSSIINLEPVNIIYEQKDSQYYINITLNYKRVF